MEEYLFNEYELRLVKEAHEKRLIDEIGDAPEEHVLHAHADEWASALAAKWRLECPVLDEDGMYQDEPEACQVDVSYDRMRYFGSSPPFVAGHRTRVDLPFTGDPDLFRMRPNTYTMGGTPKAELCPRDLRMEISYPDDSPANVAAEAGSWARKIAQHLQWIENDLAGFDQALEATARRTIAARKESIVRHREHVASTSLPMKPREGDTRTYVAEVIERRPPPPVTDMSLTKPIPLEPVLEPAIYDDIVATLRNTAVSVERSRKTYAGMNEESLRHVMLLPLNDRYRGQASAEAFNSTGKTDLLLRWENRNLFVAEMKIWKGEKSFRDAIDQLFGYVTWRDAGLALVVFVEQVDLSAVSAKARSALEGQDRFVAMRDDFEGGFEAEVRQTDGDGIARLTTLFVHLPG